MKTTLFSLLLLLMSASLAQTSTRSDFLDAFNTTLRVAQTPCPSAFAEAFSQPSCYLHGYDDFFDFKERFTLLLASLPRVERLEHWHTVSSGVGSEPRPVFRSRFQLQSGSGLTVTYLGTFIVLEFSS